MLDSSTKYLPEYTDGPNRREGYHPTEVLGMECSRQTTRMKKPGAEREFGLVQVRRQSSLPQIKCKWGE